MIKLGLKYALTNITSSFFVTTHLIIKLISEFTALVVEVWINFCKTGSREFVLYIKMFFLIRIEVNVGPDTHLYWTMILFEEEQGVDNFCYSNRVVPLQCWNL